MLVTGVLKAVCYNSAGETKKSKSQLNVFVCLVYTPQSYDFKLVIIYNEIHTIV